MRTRGEQLHFAGALTPHIAVSCCCRGPDGVRHGQRRDQGRTPDRHPARGESGRAQRDVCSRDLVLQTCAASLSLSAALAASTRRGAPWLAQRGAAPSGVPAQQPQHLSRSQPRQQQPSSRTRCRAQTRVLPPALPAAGGSVTTHARARSAAPHVPYACVVQQQPLLQASSAQQEQARPRQARA